LLRRGVVGLQEELGAGVGANLEEVLLVLADGRLAQI
jgi:hypothetical protein